MCRLVAPVLGIFLLCSSGVGAQESVERTGGVEIAETAKGVADVVLCATDKSLAYATAKRIGEEINPEAAEVLVDLVLDAMDQSLFYAMTKRIGEKINGEKSDKWAGVYALGSAGILRSTHEVMVIDPKSGFAHWDCGLWEILRVPTELDYGQVKEEKGTLVLLSKSKERPLVRKHGNVWYAVNWGDRRYLLGTKDLLDFCNHVNSGEEPGIDRASAFFLHEDDLGKAVAGEPSLPDPWKRCLLEQPLSAEIVSVAPPSGADNAATARHEVTVTLNVGRKDGVFAGMKFHGHEEPLHVFRVCDVSDATCTARSSPRLPIRDEKDEALPAPREGWKLSTVSVFGLGRLEAKRIQQANNMRRNVTDN
jgi:hypothetical protein